MGERGPSPKPTNLRMLHGDRDDRTNHNEPVPGGGEVTPPVWLSEDARSVWDRLAPDLERKGLLTPWDVDTFAILCDAIVQYQQASALVARGGVLIRGHRNAATKNPAMQLVRDTAQTVRAYAGEFGLTPSARSEISLPEEPHGKGAERLLS